MQEPGESISKTLWVSALVTLFVGLVGYGFDRLLLREGVSRTDILVLSNMLTGAVAAVLFYKLDQAARELTRRRLRTIAEMNHHIRNALQVITYATASEQKSDSLLLIRSSVERIEWSLREVLPEYATEPAKSITANNSSEA